MRFSDLQHITAGKVVARGEDHEVEVIVTDSRKAVVSPSALFFAMRGERHDSHQFLDELRARGIRQFVVEYVPEKFRVADCNVLQVASSLRALQDIVAAHRTSLKAPVIAITGSNGKTIVKEWLYQLLSPDLSISKNPGSYNSQLGVPLSVWQMQNHHQLGIFEAGISKPGEMRNLQRIIRPTLGIFTNLGTAHDEGFSDAAEKAKDKLRLFEETPTIIYCRDHEPVHAQITKLYHDRTLITWGSNQDATARITKINPSQYEISFGKEHGTIKLPFSDPASVENLFHCVTVMLHLRYPVAMIQERIQLLRRIAMRLELKDGINHCQIIDDTYNNDLAGLQISLEFLANQHQKKKKRVILSEILEAGVPADVLMRQISSLLRAHGNPQLIAIGPAFREHKNLFSADSIFFDNTDTFLSQFDTDRLQQEAILVKGARAFAFEKIVNRLQRKVHGTVMEIDLGAVIHNLNYFRSLLNPGTRLMVMVKAFAYGSGSVEIANLLQYHKVNYLGVAYADEGVELRKNNISLPIMVMNPTAETFDSLLSHNLEPEIFSQELLDEYVSFLGGRPSTIHLKLDTGMHRLGFEHAALDRLIHSLDKNRNLQVASIFSHLAGADDATHDVFSRGQVDAFQNDADKISKALGYKPLYHVLNSPGILRLQEFQLDMVRLGIGLYGIDPTTANNAPLKPVATLKTVVSQVKRINKGETVGYGRRGKAQQDMEIATIAIGYADGFSRAFSRGKGSVLIKGREAAVVGNVCMDMTMIDVTGLGVKAGEEVIVFGKEKPIHQLAEKIDTIPYEILTSTSERVKRVFVAESI